MNWLHMPFCQYVTLPLKVKVQYMVACIGLKFKKKVFLEIINFGAIDITQDFLTSAVLTFFVVGDYIVHDRLLSRILGLYSLKASSILPSGVTTKNATRHCLCPRGRQNCP